VGVTTTVSALLASVFVLALDGVLRASQIAGILLSQVNVKGGYVKVVGKGVESSDPQHAVRAMSLFPCRNG